MIKVYNDNEIFYGDIQEDKKTGRGELYLFNEEGLVHKIVGTWKDDKLYGWAYDFYEDRVDMSLYENGEKLSIIFRDEKNEELNAKFGKVCFKNKQCYYIGDLHDGLPCGFGVMFYLDDKGEILDYKFGSYLNGNLIRHISEDIDALIL